MRETKAYQPSKATLTYAAANSLGKGTVWYAVWQNFFWVDIEGKMLHEIKFLFQQVQCVVIKLKKARKDFRQTNASHTTTHK